MTTKKKKKRNPAAENKWLHTYSLQLFCRAALYTAGASCCHNTWCITKNTDFFKTWWMNDEFNYFAGFLTSGFFVAFFKTQAGPFSNSLTASLMTNQYILTWLRAQQGWHGPSWGEGRGGRELTVRRTHQSPTDIVKSLQKPPYLSYLFFITLRLGGDCAGMISSNIHYKKSGPRHSVTLFF